MTNQQNNTMIKFTIIGVVLIICSSLFMKFVNTHNTLMKLDTAIEYQYKDNQNILGTYTTKIVEMAQVPAMAKDDIIEIVKANMSGRYGQDGSKSQWQWIKENNLSIDQSLYTRLQQTMEAGRNKFENSQSVLMSKCQSLRDYERLFFTGFVAGMVTREFKPSLIENMCTPVTNSHTQNVFKTGMDNGVKLK